MKKNIIITGTSRGIGYELALQLAKAGHQVLAISRKTPQALIENENITCLSVDLGKEDELAEVDKFLTHAWEKVDVIIHNAGSLLNRPFSQTAQEDFENVYRVNVFGVANLTRVCLPYLKKGSHVVTISSMGGIQGSMKFAGLAAYSSSKGAVITLTELLAEEYKENKWLYAILGIAVYFGSQLLTGVFLGLLDLVFGWNIDWEGNTAINLLGLPIGIGFSYLFYILLESKWKKDKIEVIESIDDIGNHNNVEL